MKRSVVTIEVSDGLLLEPKKKINFWDSLLILNDILSFAQALAALILGGIALGNGSYYVYDHFYTADLFQLGGLIIFVVGSVRLMALVVTSRIADTVPPKMLGALLRSILFAALVFGGVLMVLYHDHVKGEVVSAMENYMKIYPLGEDPNDVTKEDIKVAMYAWDLIQKEEECCGIRFHIDWKRMYHSKSGGESDNMGNFSLPMSCYAPCKFPGQNDTREHLNDCTPAHVYPNGCDFALEPIASAAMGFGISAIIFALLPVFLVTIPAIFYQIKTRAGGRRLLRKKQAEIGKPLAYIFM